MAIETPWTSHKACGYPNGGSNAYSYNGSYTSCVEKISVHMLVQATSLLDDWPLEHCLTTLTNLMSLVRILAQS